MNNKFRFGLYICFIMIVLIPVQSFGHAALIKMTPSSDSQLVESPEHVNLQFNSKLEMVSDQALYVEDEAGNLIDAGPVEISDDNKSIQLLLPQLDVGTYTVYYHVMSLDGHMVMGDYNFTVLASKVEAQLPGIPDQTPDHSVDHSTDHTIPAAPDDDNEHQEDPRENSGTVPMEEEENSRSLWANVLTDIEWTDIVHMLYFLIFLLLVGMLIWYLLLRYGLSSEEARRHTNWIKQIQRLHVLILIAVVVQYVQLTVGFDNWDQVKDVLLHTTTGISWSVMLVLSLLGLILLQRNKFVDCLWILTAVVAISQIGHSAASDHRFVASLLIIIHLLAAALWAGGLLYLVILWRRNRQLAGEMAVRFSNASVIAMTILVLGGISTSLLYLSDISYVLETRWGHILLIKAAAVVGVIIIGTIIRRRYKRNGQHSAGAWIKFDFVLLIVIVCLAALLTSAEPNPPNEPLHWHVMGEMIHMTAEITPNIPGDNQFKVTVWLPEHTKEPQSVSMYLKSEPDEEERILTLSRVDGETHNYGFNGFDEYTFQVDSGQLDHAGTWSLDVEVVEDEGHIWKYEKQFRIY